MSAPSLWVRRAIQLDAAKKIRDNNTREAVELLLNSDLSFEDNGMNVSDKVDAGALLQTGLSLLNQKPHAALGVDIGAGTKEIRSHYKKLAVKYHPDKNPKTTVLFQAINSACAKLSDPTQRKVEEKSAGNTSPSTGYAGGSTKATAAGSSSANNSPPKPPNQPKYDAAADERRKTEDSARSKESSRREEEEIRRRYQEEMRRRKEEQAREGARAQQEQFARAQREAHVRLERRAAEVAAAAKRAMNGNDGPVPDAEGLKSFCTAGGRPPPSMPKQPPAEAADGRSNPPVHERRPSKIEKMSSGRTFTVDSSGNVKSKQASVDGGADKPPAIPTGLKCFSFTDTVVDLHWHPLEKGLIELNWRNCDLPTNAWRSANKLIAGTKCRKKNLLAGATYEFRIRCVDERPGGMLGLRSPWSASTLVALETPAKQKEESSSAYSYSGVDKIKKEVFIRPQVARHNSFVAESSNAPSTQSTSSASSSSAYSYIYSQTKQTVASASNKSVNTDNTKSGIPNNIRPSNINPSPIKATRSSSCEIAEDEDIKTVDPSPRHKSAWGRTSPPASEVDSESEREDEEEDSYARRHTSSYDLIAPPGSASYEHPVRKEPFLASKICGYIDAGVVVQVEADCGDWLKVKCHRPAVNKISTEKSKKKSMNNEVWGWCLHNREGHTYLSKSNGTIPEGAEDDDDSDTDSSNINGFGVNESYAGVWYEMENDEGNQYFYNDYTGESSWNPPEWIEETDPNSGAAYYMRLDQNNASPLHSTWTRPEEFAKLIRLAGAKASSGS